MFEEISLGVKIREVIIESLILFEKTAVEKLLSKKGTEYLEERYPGFNKEKYLRDVLNAKEKVHLRIEKLQNKERFSQEFIDAIRYSFEHVFQMLVADIRLYECTEFYEEEMRKFKRFKEAYEALYLDTNFGFDALLNGKTLYGEDYVKI